MDIIEVIKIILLGIIEGITEWLPVSSTGHMYLFEEFWPLKVGANPEAFSEMFFVVVQLGAILAVIVMFFSKLFPLGREQREEGGGTYRITLKKDVISMWLKVIVACIPSVVLGLLFDDILDTYLYNGVVIAITLIIYGVAFILIEIWNKKREPRIATVENLDYKTVLLIGLFQVLAMIPGTSRSGATILGALLIGVSRPAAAEFTFFLAIPTMFGASLLKMVKFLLDGGSFGGSEIAALLIGSAVAFAVSLAVIKFLMDFVRKHDFKVFGWYRIALGAIVLTVFALQAAQVL